MGSPADRVYSPSHEWHQVAGGTATIGLTRHAVDSLTDITYVQMKPVGTRFKAGDAVGEVESVKTTSDVYAFVSGEITEINPALADDPGLLNRDPYGAGWLARVRTSGPDRLSECMAAAAYDAAHPA